MKGRMLGAWLGLFFAAAGAWAQQTGQARLQQGLDLYAGGRWGEAIQQLRLLQSASADYTLRAEAEFWIAMAELSAGAYSDAVHDFDEIVRIDPGSIRRFEVPYHKGRALYAQGKYAEALALFRAYSDSIRPDGRYVGGARVGSWAADGLYNDTDGDYTRKAAAIYWIGECLYSLEDLDGAETYFTTVVREYPRSPKFEPATSRLDMIKQLRAQKELLGLLKAREAAAAAQPAASAPAAPAAQASAAPQPAAQDGVGAYKQGLEAALPTSIVVQPQAAQPQVQQPQVQQAPQAGQEALPRLLAIKANALDLMDDLITALSAAEAAGTGGW